MTHGRIKKKKMVTGTRSAIECTRGTRTTRYLLLPLTSTNF